MCSMGGIFPIHTYHIDLLVVVHQYPIVLEILPFVLLLASLVVAAEFDDITVAPDAITQLFQAIAGVHIAFVVIPAAYMAPKDGLLSALSSGRKMHYEVGGLLFD
ncbi:hypothetical protein GGR56DRAFT_654630 [Xylariaceae sp. FL0804]|nr:hypothetical protein GGR56DRAFT_654630 [Xylariaceae sp. FL0804]